MGSAGSAGGFENGGRCGGEGMLGDRRRGFGAEGGLGLVLAEVRAEAVGAGASE